MFYMKWKYVLQENTISVFYFKNVCLIQCFFVIMQKWLAVSEWRLF